jgi:two-component system OmpR family response regulator
VRVLVVEDDRALRAVLTRGLTEEGYAVDVSGDGDMAEMQAQNVEYDGIVLDIMLPGKNGLDVCRELRRNGIMTPILMLTARDTVDDAVAGFDAGADDYLRKPFAFRELRARLQAIIRRPSGTASPQIQVGDLALNVAKREVRKRGQTISLTNREHQILEYLMANPGRVLTRMMIEDHVWGHDYPGLSNTVDVHIRRLRQKLDSADVPSVIETVRGAGYRLRSLAS